MDALLKQRLTGAVVLVALGVIFVPMILEGPDRTLVPEMAELPEPAAQAPARPLDSFPAPDAIPGEPDIAVLQTDPEPVQPLQQPQGDAEPEPVPQPDITPEAPPPPATPASRPASPAAATGSWVVQVGSFSSEQNALRLRDRLRKAGFATQVEKVKVDGKPRYRVRVGPFLERTQAEERRKQIQDGFRLKGRVLSYP